MLDTAWLRARKAVGLPQVRVHDLIRNYHSFQRRERTSLSEGTRGALEGWRGETVTTRETEGQMLQRACGDLLGMKGVIVINDEAHHCYRERAGTADESELKGEASLRYFVESSSLPVRERDLAFPRKPLGVPQCLQDVLTLQVRIVVEKLRRSCRHRSVRRPSLP